RGDGAAGNGVEGGNGVGGGVRLRWPVLPVPRRLRAGSPDKARQAPPPGKTYEYPPRRAIL
ncbi:MAG: hypothetical protein E6932_28980, partial [Citrobacter freundii]|nr:hypothetical protein [Citrobacter freundii]